MSLLDRVEEVRAGLLSRPDPPRSTPITTTALPFEMCLDPQGTTSVRLTPNRFGERPFSALG
jgi:hypothetical protein